MNNKLMEFLRSVRAETKKISWPSRTEIVKSTVIVIVAIVVFAIIIGGIDVIFLQILRFFVR
ncbi:MAG TPA: preprotein translocase subunit SecE [Candidatus Aerophobetes bacterium]|uniref:Protein translocase subunit SecE n=1 Tax=Aerophobetes bacterium TaxID=2030807 RepID=A0A7V0N151_UNCAE|nr:preprotein translocase subunit SecE [Candidatus Aerophobetes bacterium]